MSRTWKPGDVAMVEVGCHANRHVAISTGRGWRYGDDKWVASDPAIVSARPLVVLDLARTKGRAFLPDWLRIHATEIARKSAGGHASVADDLRYIADQIEAQTKPPKPAEPTDPSVRVIDHGCVIWASQDGRWYALGVALPSLPWDELCEKRGPVQVLG